MKEARHLRSSSGVWHAIAVPLALWLIAGLVLLDLLHQGPRWPERVPPLAR